MEDGYEADSLPTQKTGSGSGSGGRLGTKSSSLQRSSNSQTGSSKDPEQSVVMARKSSTKVNEDTRSFRQPYASSDDRSRQFNAVEVKTRSRGDAPSMQQSNAAGKAASPNASQNRNRMKSSTGNIARTRSNQPENLARKSGYQERTSSPNVIASSQSTTQVKGPRAPLESARPFLSGTIALAGPSNHFRNDFRGTERPTTDLTRNSGLSRAQIPLALPSSSVNHYQITQSSSKIMWAGRHLSVITPAESAALSVKSGPMKPHWQLDEEERAKEQETVARIDYPDRDFIKRIASARRPTATSQAHRFKNVPKHPKSYLGRNLTLKKQGESDREGDYDPPMEMEEQSLPPHQTIRLQQTGIKAARKREWPQPLFLDPDSKEDEPMSSSDEMDELDSSDSSLSEEDEDIQHSDIEEIVITAQRQRSLSPAEIEILPGPPRPPSPLSIPKDMLKAIKALSLASVRMQSTERLPFLRRNLRRGFEKRCRQLGVPTEPSPEQGNRLRVQYEYQSKIVTARLHDWACPLCELHGFFPTREMLACHLSWDHDEAPAAWKQYRSGIWYLRLTIMDPLTELTEDEHGVSPTEQPVNVTIASHTPVPRRQADFFGPFSLVTLSPLGLGSASASSSAQPRAQDLSSPITIVRDSPPLFASTSPDSRSMISPTPLPPSSHSRSAATATATTTVTSSARRPRDPRYPTPPPPTNPLGPAAQPPYLPAKSEYGGPDIYYSCRPGGECLYDLLNTLPLEPYGVLAWDVLDREDEIYDSDNVKDEYKVMHALWGRWIVLNRKTFIKNYYKGTQAFIDYYWRMIHRAAGWDALRYWLLMLVVNRFITGAEVASLLKHYETLTGMDTWYD